ncbi:MAG: hypothetical protein WBB64_03040 [Anaerolineales bacterium]
MSTTVIVHIRNAEPILAEVEELPQASDTLITLINPRQRDGKDLMFLERNVVNVIWPLAEISFIEILPGETAEDVVSFIRE